MFHRKQILLAGLTAATALWPVQVLADHPLRRDLRSYFIFAMRSLQAKDLKLSGVCNVGVNCAQPADQSFCGQASFEHLRMGDDSQLAAEDINFQTPAASVWQLFTNHPYNTANVEVRHPPVEPLSPLPIIPGTCDPGCVPHYDAIEALCGFPNPFPACDPLKMVEVKPGKDCLGATDTVPGNGTCNLPPGSYGEVLVRDNGVLVMDAGTYDVCALHIGKNTDVDGKGTVVNVAAGDPHSMRVSNNSTFGAECGDLTVRIAGTPQVILGKSSTIAAKICAPAASLALGHGNTLIGQFVGDRVSLDRSNVAQCCGGKCTCIDSFTPLSAHVGETVTLSSGCNLDSATAVRICGIDTPIVSVNSNSLVVAVPAGATGDCEIEVESVPGVFTTRGTLHILP